MEVIYLRLALTSVLGTLLAIVASDAFDGLQWPLFAPVVVTTAMAVPLVRVRNLIRLPLVAISVLIGVMSATLLAGGAMSDVARAVVDGPRQLLTTEWPSPAIASVVGAVALLIGTTVAIALDLAGQARWHLAPLGVIAVGWAAAMSIGAPVRPPVWVLVVGAAAAILLALTRHESGGRRSSVAIRKDRTVVVSAVAVGIAAIGTASAIAWADRADPRQTEDAEINAAVIDPIEASVALRRADPVFGVFAITDRSRVVGQSFPARWRIAALDNYDGQRWVPRLALRPIGGRLGLPAPAGIDRPPAVDYELEYLSDDIDLLPYPGAPLSASVDVETDLDRVVVRSLERPVIGDRVLMASEVGLTSRSSLSELVSRRQVDDLAGGFTEQARRLAGDGTLVEQLRRIEATMQEDWQLDPSTPGGGQQLALIERFVLDTNRGTREQFVTAYVLMVRSLGFDARIATGFLVPPGSVGSPLRLQSDMASVWPEVRFDDVGWVAFDPVPALETRDEDQQPPPPDAQTPAAAQPPIAPPTDEVDDQDDEAIAVDTGADPWSGLRRALVRGATYASIGLLPFFLTVGAILGIKWARRRRRRREPDPVRRIRGVWANATDSLVDAGMTIAPSWTDDAIASAASAMAPSVPHEVRRLAAMSTQMTFGSTGRAAVLVDDAVLTSDAVDRAILAERTRWQRLRWRLSLRSLRPSTRSPVAPGS